MFPSDVSHDEWKGYCDGCELSSIYHDPRWLELIESVYPKLKIHRLVCRDAFDQICWLLPLVEIKPFFKTRPMLISIPFGNYGGIIVPKNKGHKLSKNDLVPLVDFFGKNHAFALELREKEAPEYGFHTHDYFKTFEIVFPKELGELWERVISGKARNKIRKASRLGVKVFHDHEKALNIFQRLYELNASYHGTPIHHKRWFERLALIFGRETEIVLGQYKGTFIGALLLLHYQGKSFLHLAVTDPKHKMIPVTDKLIWSSFERIIQNGISMNFDFGRTRPEAGKLVFKRKWGGLEHPIYYSYLIKQGQRIPRILPENPIYKPAIRVWRYLPMELKRSIGPFFRSRIPT